MTSDTRISGGHKVALSLYQSQIITVYALVTCKQAEFIDGQLTGTNSLGRIVAFSDRWLRWALLPSHGQPGGYPRGVFCRSNFVTRRPDYFRVADVPESWDKGVSQKELPSAPEAVIDSLETAVPL